MWVFQNITLLRATNSAKSQAKIRFAFHFVERKYCYIYLPENKKFDWLFIVDPIWLVGHTYISHSLIELLITYPKCTDYDVFFLQKKNLKN